MRLLTQWAFTSSALILIVLAVRYLFREKLSARLKYALWGVVLLRLLVPFQVELPAPVSDSLPVLATNMAQDVSPWLEDQMLYAVPTERYLVDRVQPGEEPEYSRTLHSEANREYYSGGVVYDKNGITRYFFMMPASELLTMLWGIGAGLCLLVILYSNWGFSLRLGRRRRRLEDIDSPIPVYTVEGLPSPCLFGVFKPAVYVTPQAAEDPDTLRHVLAHELTHYAHRDHLWSLLRCFSLALHWYNPLVWLAVVLSKGDGELACDEGAVARLGEGERIPYGRTLVDMVAARSLRPADLLSCSTAMTGGGKSVKQRVAQLVKKPETVKAALFAAVALVVLAAVFVFAERGPKRDKTFLYYLIRTTAIHYCPPLYSNTIYPNPIVKGDLLGEAKEALSGFQPLEDGDPPPDLSPGAVLHESRIILTLEDDGETEYSLLWQNDRTYLFPGSIWRQSMGLQEEEGNTAQLLDVNGTYISKEGDNVISTIRRLAGGQARLLMDPMPMLQSELEEYSRKLLREGDTPLLGRPGGAGGLEFHYGCTSGDDLWLWYRGDQEHNTVWVLSLKRSGEELTLLDDQPMVVFNAAQNPRERPAYEVLAPMAFAAFLRPEDIDTITAGDYFPGQAVELDAQALADQLSQAAYYEFSDEFDLEKYGQLVLTIQVKEGDVPVPYHPLDEGAEEIDETASRRLVLSVGQEADAVCLYHQNFGYNRNMTGRQYVRSPELYRTIQALYDLPSGQIPLGIATLHVPDGESTSP